MKITIGNLEIPLLPTILLLSATYFLFFKSDKKESKKKTRTQPVALSPNEYRDFPLIEIEEISHDVKRFRFGLPEGHRAGLPVGQHISLKYVDAEGKTVSRSYTPTSSDDDIGFIDFVVKIYRKNVHPRFPEGGKMSQHLESLKIGDTISMMGPKGHLEYLSNGRYTIKKRESGKVFENEYKMKKIGMIAGGTGITPMLQIITEILKNKDDKTQIYLLFANQTPNDILLKDVLDSYPKDQVHVTYTVDRVPEDYTEKWTGFTGFVTKEMLEQALPAPSDDLSVFMCGPPIMIDKCLKPNLAAIGHKEENWFCF